MSDFFIFGDKTPWTDAGGGVQRQIAGWNDDIMMVKVRFKKGQRGALHTHPHSQVTFVAEGAFEFKVGDRTEIVRAGDSLYQPSGMEHGCLCLEDGLLIDCFSPARKDFLK